MINLFKNKKETEFQIQVVLHCPDGFKEYMLFNFPRDTLPFISTVNTFNEEDDGYSVELKPYGQKQRDAFILQSLIKNEGIKP